MNVFVTDYIYNVKMLQKLCAGSQFSEEHSGRSSVFISTHPEDIPQT